MLRQAPIPFPETSRSAHRSVQLEMLTKHYGKIMNALKHYPVGLNYCEIAVFTNLDKHQVNRRLKEMRNLNLIEFAGKKSKTESGRFAEIHRIKI